MRIKELKEAGKVQVASTFSDEELDALRESGGLSQMLIDRCFIPPFVFDKSHRRRLLGAQIAVLKTVWDIASRNRARRFLVILERIQQSKESPN